MAFPESSLGLASRSPEPEAGTLVQPLPALGLPPEALQSLRQAFTREVGVRLPRLLDLVRNADREGQLALAIADAAMLAEGCALLGDAAAARALRRLADLLSGVGMDNSGTDSARTEAAATAALLLGRWSAGSQT